MKWDEPSGNESSDTSPQEKATEHEANINYAKWGEKPPVKIKTPSTTKLGAVARRFLTNLGTNPLSQPSLKLNGLKVLVAELVLDTGRSNGGSLGLAGLRAAPEVATSMNLRQLLFQVDDGRIEVDLQFRRNLGTASLNLIGQVIGCNGNELRVLLMSLEGGQVLEIVVDEDTFTFHSEQVPAGSYDLHIHCGEEFIQLREITI